MAETKEDIAAERDALRAENEKLRAQLAAVVTTGHAYAPRFQLSEGHRAELELHGVTDIGGKRMTADEVRALLAESDTQAGVVIGDPVTA
jgi:hypothetical protein